MAYIAIMFAVSVLILFAAFFVKGRLPFNASENTNTSSAHMFGTNFYIRAYGRKSKAALDKSLKRLEELEKKFSVFIESSEISRINKYAGFEPQKVSDEVFSITESAYKYAKMTDGSFDPTVEPLIKLWSIGKENFKVPDDCDLGKVLDMVNFKDIEMNSEQKTIRLKRLGQKLSFGAIAKGYAADVVKDILFRNKVYSAFIDLGGNIYALGSNPDGTPWKIGVQDPLKPRGTHLGVVSVTNKSVVTSGNYERYSLQDGRIYHHILDTKTGYPSDNGLISVTIVSKKSIDGDALTTAVYVMGLEKGLKFVESLEDIDAIFITQNKKVYLSSGIKESFKLTNGGYELC